MYACSIILPFAYLVGLLFTLKTHSYIFENVEPDEQVQLDQLLFLQFGLSLEIIFLQDAPRWTILKSGIILGVAIALFSIVSEGLVVVLEPALHELGLNQTFAGLTVMALVPSSAEVAFHSPFQPSFKIADSPSRSMSMLYSLHYTTRLPCRWRSALPPRSRYVLS